MERAKLFGREIVPELSNMIDDALDPGYRRMLFDFASAKSKVMAKRWVSHFRRRGVPCVTVAHKNGQQKIYTIFKRKFVYDKEKKSVHLKTCNCNPLDQNQGCMNCRPDFLRQQVYKRNKAARAA